MRQPLQYLKVSFVFKVHLHNETAENCTTFSDKKLKLKKVSSFKWKTFAYTVCFKWIEIFNRQNTNQACLEAIHQPSLLRSYILFYFICERASGSSSRTAVVRGLATREAHAKRAESSPGRPLYGWIWRVILLSEYCFPGRKRPGIPTCVPGRP